MTNSIILLTPIEAGRVQDHKPTARQDAQMFFKEHMAPAGYTHIREVESPNTEMTVTPLDSPDGEKLVDQHLQKTRNNRQQEIEKIHDRLKNDDANDLVEDREFKNLCRHLHGRAKSRLNALIDGTSWSRGEMIASEERLEEIIANAVGSDMELFAVEMTCEF